VEAFNLCHLFTKKSEKTGETTTEHSISCLPNISSYALAGKRLAEANLAFWGGFGLNFNLKKRKLDDVKLLGSLFQDKHKVKVATEVTLRRVDDADDKSHFSPSVRVHFDAAPMKNNRTLGSAEYDTASKSCKWNIVNEHSVDAATRLKVKINQDYAVTGAVIHSFNSNTNFALTANVNYVPRVEEKHNHLKYRFGATLEFLDV